MKSVLAVTLAGLVFAGNAMAADGLRIESEAQFVRDYGDRIEQIGPGVYLIVAGELAGKTVSIGEAGLAYDISVQRGQLTGSSRSKAQTRALIRQMEGVRMRYKELHAHQASDVGTKNSYSGTFRCVYRSGGMYASYNGYAMVEASTELYLDNGGGGLNWYYARASANASGYVFPPHYVPPSFSVNAGAHAENRDTGQVSQRSASGINSVSTATDYVYSGPVFSHNLFAVATVSGTGNCYGYVSISDTMQ